MLPEAPRGPAFPVDDRHTAPSMQDHFCDTKTITIVYDDPQAVVVETVVRTLWAAVERVGRVRHHGTSALARRDAAGRDEQRGTGSIRLITQRSRF
jgi:hypothetical protein